MFKVIYRFADLQDDNHVYEVGDKYPRDGYEVADSRIAELSGNGNKIGKPLIEKVVEKKPKKKTATEKVKEAD